MDHMTFSRSKKALTTSLAILALATSGCAGIADTASSAASSAATQLADGAKKELIKQVCAPIKDGTVNADDLKIVTSMVDAVREGGLPEEIVSALDDVAASGDKVPADVQARLITACENASV
ncbi:hypothetical protein CGQ24_04615 [Arthrobacter sp. 7749]|nr:hypothetical protein CGQ24_04615 [Arthrobacter sp. 7749]